MLYMVNVIYEGKLTLEIKLSDTEWIMIYLSLYTYNLLNINAMNVEFCITALFPFPSIPKKTHKIKHITVIKWEKRNENHL